MTEREIRLMLQRRLTPLPPPSEEIDRASGDALCSKCGYALRLHPMDTNVLSYSGEPILNVLCDGSRVKL